MQFLLFGGMKHDDCRTQDADETTQLAQQREPLIEKMGGQHRTVNKKDDFPIRSVKNINYSGGSKWQYQLDHQSRAQ